MFVMVFDMGRLSLERSVVLVGLMGSGKSKVGRALSETFGVLFVDTDKVIESVSGMSVAEIFERDGEEAFRAIEAREIAKLLSGAPSVISTGGGAFMDDETRRIINEGGWSVWLTAKPETLAGRISNPSTRPLLKGRDAVSVLRALSDERSVYYGEAHMTIDTDGLSLDDAIDKVRRVMIKRLSKDRLSKDEESLG